MYPTTGEAWGQIMHELRRGVSEFGNPVFTIDLVGEIVDEWGWSSFVEAFRGSDPRNISILQGRFGDEYAERVKRFNSGLAQTDHEWDIAEDVLLLPQPSEPARKPEAAAFASDDWRPNRDPQVDAHMAALRVHIKSMPVLMAAKDQARAEVDALLNEVSAARAANDGERLAKAMAAVEAWRTPAAYRKAQAAFLEAVEAGLGEDLLRWPKVCRVCQGQRVVIVHHDKAHLVQSHWSPVKAKDAPINSVGTVYHCPECVTPSVKERGERAA